MFSLIIAIISVALIAILSLATMYYGGTSFNQGSERAKAASLYNETTQIEGAIKIYKVETGNYPSSLQDLIDKNYLTSVSSRWVDNYMYFESSPDISLDVCQQYNKKKGIDVVPSCDDPTYAKVVVCCTN